MNDKDVGKHNKQQQGKMAGTHKHNWEQWE
jgi:hypothetical protein